MPRQKMPHIHTCKKKRGYQKSKTNTGVPPYTSSGSINLSLDEPWISAKEYEKQHFIGRSTTILLVRNKELIIKKFKGRLYVKEPGGTNCFCWCQKANMLLKCDKKTTLVHLMYHALWDFRAVAYNNIAGTISIDKTVELLNSIFGQYTSSTSVQMVNSDG